ncbi:MAG: hypothetical protein FJZ01_03500 [Candidatus Sericytochromatia bacterium]|nr:hypothetical protein [Candidatus Tanganyikabacteria bacterium]
MYVFSPASPHENPALLEVVFEDRSGSAFVMFAAEADEEELDQWIRS